MLVKLQILFTILSAVFVAGVFPLGIIINWTAAIISALAAFFFFSLMYLCKQKNKELHPEQYQTPTDDETEEPDDTPNE